MRTSYMAIAAVCIVAALAAAGLFALSGSAPQVPGSGDRIKVVASFYPMYDFASNVGGDRVRITTLIPAGVEPHEYEPKPSDIRSLGEARIFILNGVVEEPWAEELVEGVDNPGLLVVDTSKGIELIGSQDADEPGNDPHIWLSPVLAQKQVAAIRDALIQADPAGKEHYEANAAAYIAELDALDAEFRAAFATCNEKDILITHATLGYFCREYGCNQVPLKGVNAEGEPTPQVIEAIIDQAMENNITVVFTESLYNPQTAQVIAGDIGGTVAVFNTVHGLTAEEQALGADYVSQMMENAATIRASLGCS